MSRLVCFPLLFAALAACSDPVRDDAIDALGPETGAPGPDHRPGTPCLLCHSNGGPASSYPYKLAGTVFKEAKANADGLGGVALNFVDALGNGPASPPTTSDSGNFYVRESAWPDMAFPVRVGVYADEKADKPLIEMQSNINREGSCNFCHRPLAKNPTDADIAASRGSAGPIFATAPASQ